jgi:hypothetical protein
MTKSAVMGATFARVIPPAVLRRVADRSAFLNEVSRYIEMSDDDLLYATEVCLRNLESLYDLAAAATSDGDLQLVLVPELWERLRPGTRDGLRRITSTLAEYNPNPGKPSIFAQLLSPETLERLREGADVLRQRVAHVALLDSAALVEQVRFAIAGSRASDRWSPSAFVYEPGFVYRLVPAITWRVLVRSRQEGTT